MTAWRLAHLFHWTQWLVALGPFIQIVASFLAPAHSPVLFAVEFAFLPNLFARSADRTDPADEAFFHEIERVKREIHFDSFAI
jgi:hypothetical protein